MLPATDVCWQVHADRLGCLHGGGIAAQCWVRYACSACTRSHAVLLSAVRGSAHQTRMPNVFSAQADHACFCRQHSNVPRLEEDLDTEPGMQQRAHGVCGNACLPARWLGLAMARGLSTLPYSVVRLGRGAWFGSSVGAASAAAVAVSGPGVSGNMLYCTQHQQPRQHSQRERAAG